MDKLAEVITEEHGKTLADARGDVITIKYIIIGY